MKKDISYLPVLKLNGREKRILYLSCEQRIITVINQSSVNEELVQGMAIIKL